MNYLHSTLFLLSILLCQTSGLTAQYYDFPACGWTQAVEMIDAPPAEWNPRFNIKSYAGDTVINGYTFHMVTESFFRGKMTFIRQDNGQVYRYRYGIEELLYDFSSEIGDTVEVFSNYLGTEKLIVSDKGKYLSESGDSLISLSLNSTDIFPFQITWLEGVGNQSYGLYNDYFGIESDEIASSTRDAQGIIYQNDYPLFTFDFEFLNGEDRDGDGAFNHYGSIKTVVIDDCYLKETMKIRECDTLRIINNCIYPAYVSESISGFDTLFTEYLIQQGDSATIPDFYDRSRFVIHHQYDSIYFFFTEVLIYPCTPEDCDDLDPLKYPCAEEIPNNTIDEDCDGSDLIISSQQLSPDFPLVIYPNPVINTINLRSDSRTPDHISLYDSMGKEVLRTFESEQINVSSLPDGIYFVEVVFRNGEIATMKILIAQ